MKDSIINLIRGKAADFEERTGCAPKYLYLGREEYFFFEKAVHGLGIFHFATEKQDEFDGMRIVEKEENNYLGVS